MLEGATFRGCGFLSGLKPEVSAEVLMKEAMSVQTLALELKRQAQATLDLTAPTTKLAIRHEPVIIPEVVSADSTGERTGSPASPVPLTMLVVGDEGEFVVSDITHRQVSQHLGIHAKYYDRLRTEQPDMLEYNVNEMFRRYESKRLVRTLDGRARAFLGNTYNVGLSNMALAEYLLPVIGELGGEVRSSAITDRKAYLKIVLPTIEREVRRVGQIIRLGVVLYNSEIGFGKWGFDLFTETLSCTNGMTVGFAQKVVKTTQISRLFVQLDFLHKKSFQSVEFLIGLRACLKTIFSIYLKNPESQNHLGRSLGVSQKAIFSGVEVRAWR